MLGPLTRFTTPNAMPTTDRRGICPELQVPPQFKKSNLDKFRNKLCWRRSNVDRKFSFDVFRQNTMSARSFEWTVRRTRPHDSHLQVSSNSNWGLIVSKTASVVPAPVFDSRIKVNSFSSKYAGNFVAALRAEPQFLAGVLRDIWLRFHQH